MLLLKLRYFTDLNYFKFTYIFLIICISQFLFLGCDPIDDILLGSSSIHECGNVSERNVFSRVLSKIYFQLFPCEELYSSNQIPTTFAFPSESLMGEYPSNVNLLSNYDSYFSKNTFYSSSYRDIDGQLLEENSRSTYSESTGVLFEDLGASLSLSYLSTYNENLEVSSETSYQRISDLPVISLVGSYSLNDFYLSSSLGSTFSFSFSVNSDVSYQLEYLGNCESGVICDTIKGSAIIINSGDVTSDSIREISIPISTEDYVLKPGFLKNKFYLYVTDSSSRVSYISFYLVRDDAPPSISGTPTSDHEYSTQAVNNNFSFTFYSVEPLYSLSYTVTTDGSLPSDPTLEDALNFNLGTSVTLSRPENNSNLFYRYRFMGVDLAGNTFSGSYDILFDRTTPMFGDFLIEALDDGSYQNDQDSDKVFVRDPRLVLAENALDGSFDLSWSVLMNFSEEEFLSVEIEIVDATDSPIGTLFLVEDVSKILTSSSSSSFELTSLDQGVQRNPNLDSISTFRISRTSSQYVFDFDSIRFYSDLIVDNCSGTSLDIFLCSNYDNIIRITIRDKSGNESYSRFYLHPDSQADGDVVPVTPYRDISFSCLPSSSNICPVTFSWSSLTISSEPSGVSEYILEISDSINFDTISYTGRFSDNNNMLVSFGGASGDIANATNGLFFWKIRYVDNVGNELLESNRLGTFYLGRSIFDLLSSTSGELTLGLTSSNTSEPGVIQVFSGDSLDSCDVSNPSNLCINYDSTNFSSVIIRGEDYSFGYKVSYLPDVTGDKKSELLVIANQYENNSISYGKLYVIKSQAFSDICNVLDGTPCIIDVSSLSSEYLYSYVPVNSDIDFGSSLSYIGDYNLDGFSDFAVGASGASNLFGGANLQFGTVYVFSFNSISDSQDFSFSAREISFPALSEISGSAGFGFVICNMDDLNNDGNVDIFIGAPHARYSNFGESVSYSSGIGYLITSLSNSEEQGLVNVDSYQTIYSPSREDGATFGSSCSKGYDLSDLPNSPVVKSFLVGSPTSRYENVASGQSYLFAYLSDSPFVRPVSLGSFSAGGSNALFGQFITLLNIGSTSSLIFSAPSTNVDSGSIYQNSKSDVSFTPSLEGDAVSLGALSVDLLEGYNTASLSLLNSEVNVGAEHSVFSDLDGNSVFALLNKDNTYVYIYLGNSVSSLSRFDVSIDVENVDTISIGRNP